MLSKLKLILGTILVSWFYCAPSSAIYWSPHMGADYKYWNVEPFADKNNDFVAGARQDYRPLFPKIGNTFNVYFGSRIDGYYNIDIGFEQSVTKEKTRIFNGTELYFGNHNGTTSVNYEPGTSATVDIRFKTFHIDLGFHYEVVRRLELLAMFGMALLQPDTHIFYVLNGNRFELQQETPSKWIARFGFGAQYNIGPYVGIKGQVIFDQTKRYNIIGTNALGQPFDIAPYKSATSYLLGIVFSYSKPWR